MNIQFPANLSEQSEAKRNDNVLDNGNEGSRPAAIETEMQKSYLEYAMSVIVSRAIPDVRDGCKPVHRRILYALYKMSNKSRNYFKSARVVGETMGKYHPHGDSAIYHALVRMAQPFSLSAPLIDGQGNFGSIDGDSPAQMRYTEVRLEKLTYSMLDDIGLETVDFQDNYDGSEQEPRVLPASFPNVLVNGANGIAVGMATNIPTFNLGEVIDACCAYIDNPEITAEEMLSVLPGPDFPTGGEIIGIDKLNQAMLKGHGVITLRGKSEIETEGGRTSIIITSIPYQVNKSDMVRNIELSAREKQIEGVTDIRDESSKLGMRVVVDLRRDAEPEVVLNQIYRYSQLESSFGVNMLVLRDYKPELMNCVNIVAHFIRFREEVVTKRTSFLLGKARDRAHVLVGLLVAIQNIDAIIKIVKETKDPAEARQTLMNTPWRIHEGLSVIEAIADPRTQLLYAGADGDGSGGFGSNIDIEPGASYIRLTATQANAILEMRIQRLTGIEIQKIKEDLEELFNKITYYVSILQSPARLLGVIKDELVDIKERFAVPRRTAIVANAADINEEDLIKQEAMVVTVTRTGYIKRTPLSHYREQRRGGKGKNAMSTHDDDIVTDVIVTTTHHSIMFFSDLGKVYRIKVYKLPQGLPTSKGRALVNLIPLASGEKISSILAISDECSNEGGPGSGSDSGELDDCSDEVGKSGGDVGQGEVGETDNAAVATTGKAAGVGDLVAGHLFPIDQTAAADGDDNGEIGDVDAEADTDPDEGTGSTTDNRHYFIFATARGNARRNLVSDFRNIPTNGKIAIKLADDRLVGVILCKAQDHIMLATKHGKAIRFPVSTIRVFKGRTATGVRAVRLMKNDDAVVSLSVLAGLNVSSEVRESYLKLPVNKRIDLRQLPVDDPRRHDLARGLAKSSATEYRLDPDLIMNMAANEEFILTVTCNGYGKRSSSYEYRLTGRGGQGVSNMETSRRNGLVVAVFPVQHNDGIMVVTDKGTMIRTTVGNIRITSRNTMGVRIMDLQPGDAISSVSKVVESERECLVDGEESVTITTS